MQDRFTLAQFLKLYSTNEKCLEKIKQVRFPEGITCRSCQKLTKHYKVTDRLAYACEFCGTHVYPLAGTIFEKSTTPLTSWFYAMFLLIHTRSGISAKQLQRELGVTYKTAWRIFKQLRLLMAETSTTPLEGVVEVDETFIGGKGMNRRYVPNFSEKPKEVVMGVVQRGGKAYLKHVPNTGKWTLIKQIDAHVSPKARVITDQHPGYYHLKKHGYNHQVVNHNVTFVSAKDVHTNNAENIWSQLKRGIFGVYRHVSKKYLQAYVDEYSWRYNYRKANGQMFNLLLSRVALVRPAV